MPKGTLERWARKGVEAHCMPTTQPPNARIDLNAVMAELGKRGFLQVMVEGMQLADTTTAEVQPSLVYLWEIASIGFVCRPASKTLAYSLC